MLINQIKGKVMSNRGIVSHAGLQQANLKQRIHTVAPTSQKFFVGASNKKAKLLVLQVVGLSEETKKTCEEYLLSVRGVVSITFNMAKLRAMVRVIPSITAEKLCESIALSKVLTADQVVRNKSGEEVVLSFGRKPSVPEDEKAKNDIENDFPDYLPEDDPEETSKTAIARPGDKDSNGGSGWFSGVSNFISSSLYW